MAIEQSCWLGLNRTRFYPSSGSIQITPLIDPSRSAKLRYGCQPTSIFFFCCFDLKYTFGIKFELTALAGLAEIVFFAVVSVMTLDLLVVLLKTRRDAEDSRQNCE